MLVGSICTLAYFQFGARVKNDQPPSRPAIVESMSKIGEVFLAITLGALFAGVFASAVTALVERLDSLRLFVVTYLIK